MAENNTPLRETHISPPDKMRDVYRVGQEVDERIVHSAVCPALVTFGIYLTGLTDCAADRATFRFARLIPRYGQALVCLEGQGRVYLQDEWVVCRAGQAYLTGRSAFHAYQAVPGHSWRLAWVLFDGGKGVPDPAASVTLPRLVDVDPQPLAVAIDGLHREVIGGPAAPALSRLWAELVRAQAARLFEPDAIDPRLRRMLASVEARLDFAWSVPELARQAFLSQEQTRRLCHAQLGRSPMRHVTYLRMRHAAALLSSGAYTVGAAAARVGYANDFAFSTAFKRCMGRSPSTYREEAG